LRLSFRQLIRLAQLTYILRTSLPLPLACTTEVLLIDAAEMRRRCLRHLCVTVPRRCSLRRNRTGAYHMLIYHSGHPSEGLAWSTAPRTLATHKASSPQDNDIAAVKKGRKEKLVFCSSQACRHLLISHCFDIPRPHNPQAIGRSSTMVSSHLSEPRFNPRINFACIARGATPPKTRPLTATPPLSLARIAGTHGRGSSE
jgi:hypothetical protein